MSNPEDAIEAVARAIYECEPHFNQGEPLDWSEIIGAMREDRILEAQAALAAAKPFIERELLKRLYNLPNWKDGKLDVFYLRKVARDLGYDISEDSR